MEKNGESGIASIKKQMSQTEESRSKSLGKEEEWGTKAKKIVHVRTRLRNIHWLDSPSAPAASLIVTGSSEPVTSDSFRFRGRPFCTPPEVVIGLCS